MVERGEPIERPPVYRTLIFAFAIWAAHFIASYGAVLIFPEQAIARWIAVAALVMAAGALTFWTWRLGPSRAPPALAAVGLAMAGIVLGTFPALVG